MKNTKYIFFMLIFALFLVTSCEREKTSKGISTVTNFAALTMNGNEVTLVELDQPYNEPGVTAEENGTPVDVITYVSSAYNGYEGSELTSDVADKYTITYSATNSDGYEGSVERLVYVAAAGDLTTSLAGLYLMSVVRTNNDETYTDILYALIWEVDDDVYEISDAIGGFYADGRGFGDGYRAAGATITVNDLSSNDFTFTGAGFPAEATEYPMEIVSMTVNAVNKTITMVSEWPVDAETTYHFNITLKQVEL